MLHKKIKSAYTVSWTTGLNQGMLNYSDVISKLAHKIWLSESGDTDYGQISGDIDWDMVRYLVNTDQCSGLSHTSCWVAVVCSDIHKIKKLPNLYRLSSELTMYALIWRLTSECIALITSYDTWWYIWCKLTKQKCSGLQSITELITCSGIWW